MPCRAMGRPLRSNLPEGPHGDRGGQYRSHDYRKVLRRHGLEPSMSGKGNCRDDAAVLRREINQQDCSLILVTFLKTLKAELI